MIIIKYINIRRNKKKTANKTKQWHSTEIKYNKYNIFEHK